MPDDRSERFAQPLDAMIVVPPTAKDAVLKRAMRALAKAVLRRD